MELQQRVDRLEKERWLYLGLAVLGVIAGLVATILALAGKKTTPGAFELGPTAGDALVMRDAQGHIRAVLGFKDDQPQLRFIDKQRKIRELVGLDRDGQPQFQLNNEAETTRAEFRVSQAGLPSLDFYDSAGARRQTLGIDTLAPSLEFLDPQGRTRLKLQDEASGAKMELFDSAGKRSFAAP